MGKINYASVVHTREQTLGRLEDLDDNQRPFAERLIEQVAMSGQDYDDDATVDYAVQTAARLVPTAREASKMIAGLRVGPAYCYLAFYGIGSTSQYAKVGMTNHPEKRLYGMSTSNPLDCLWAFIAQFPTRPKAYGAEQAILRELSEHKRRGEWIEVVASLDEAAEMARQMSGLFTGGVRFVPLSYRDGREAA